MPFHKKVLRKVKKAPGVAWEKVKSPTPSPSLKKVGKTFKWIGKNVPR